MQIMKTVAGASLLAAAMLATPAIAGTVNAGHGWKCTANLIADASYSGSGWAYIHLSPYNGGHQYPVTLSGNGKKATGHTSDGTPFTCTKG